MDALSVLSGVLILLVLISVRRAHIRVEYSVSWLAAGVVLLVLSRWRGAVNALAGVLGLDQPALAIFFIAASVFLLVFFRFTILVSQLKDANIALTQRLAILQYQVERLHGQKQEQEAQRNAASG